VLLQVAVVKGEPNGMMEYWNIGGVVFNASLHYSIVPGFQSVVRCSQAIERNEAYEFFSAASQEDYS
jgi:hypothetical protein